MKEHHRLVRDRVPDLIYESGKSFTIRHADNDETFSLLLDRIVEHTEDLRINPRREDLADILEAIYSAAEKKGWTLQELENVRAEKRAARGAFQENVVLLYTD